MLKDLHLLGCAVKDKVTGFTGIVSTVGYDLYGCIQAIVTPTCDSPNANEVKNGSWFDTKRLEVISPNPVMEVPKFDIVAGGTEKPELYQKPDR